jgi:predicted ATPase
VLGAELGVEPGPALERLERQILDHDPELLGSGTGTVTGGEAEIAIADGSATFLAVHVASHEAAAMRERVMATATRHGGVEAPSPGGLMVGFARARDAAAAAAAILRGFRHEGPGVPMGLAAADARHAAAVAHPGQVVLTRDARERLREAPLHGVDVRELGDHRLGDLAPAQPLFQLLAPGLDVEFPPTPGLETRATNLPVQSTSLIGRAEEIAEVGGLLRDPAIRLVTLIGPGGTGKTRLALHATASLLEDAPDGAWFVALDALADPALVVPTIATAMGSEGAGSVAALATELGGGRVLLVLDNFEHLLPAAGALEELLRATAHLKVLVTSRVPLRLEDERAVAVSPLPTPSAEATVDAATLAGFDSVALFVDRARAARPEFTLRADNAPAVAALCRALDGLPLAVELAASQVGLVSPAGLLDRLDRAARRVTRGAGRGPERHRALQATIDWSHELLDEATRALFADVAVFAGGWTLEAAESVCDGGRDVIGGMARLVDHSLVRVGGTEAEPRFGMLETIREYAAARLDAGRHRPHLEARHVAFFQALADAAEPHLRGNPGEWIARLERDHDNLRAAIDRLGSRRDGAAEARLAGTLWRFWYLAGHLAEGRSRLERAVAVHPEPTPARVKALIGAAVMAVNSADPASARDRAEEALRLSGQLGDAWSAAYAQFMLGAALRGVDDLEGARSAGEASLRAFRKMGDDHSALLASRNLAGTLEDLGERAAAEELYRDNLRRARADGNGRLEASTLGALATIAFDEGRIGDATLMLRESLRIHRDLADRLDTAVDLGRAAELLALSGKPDAAARLVGALDAARDQLGARGRVVAEASRAVRVRLQRQLTEDRLRLLAIEGEGLRIEEALALALEALESP